MMGLGSLGNGGSSSSFSNLSPLAPPFTVDRSNSKPNSNQLLNFSDSSYAGSVPFGQSWQYADPSATGYNFFPKHEIVTDSVPTTCMPLSPEFSPSDSVKPSSNLWSTSNPIANASTDTYSFGHEGYYGPYLPSIVNNDHPPATFNEPSLDALPNSGNIPVNASSQVDYTQSLSGLEYPVSHWSFFSKVADGKQDERKGVDGSFSLGKVNTDALFGYRNCMSQGNSLEGVNIAGEDSGALSGNFTDGVYTGPTSMGHMAAKSYIAQEPIYPSLNSKTTMGSILPVSCQVGLSLGSSNNYLNYENPFTPQEKFFQPHDSCPRDTTSTSKSSPAVVIRPAPSGRRLFTPKTDLHKNVDICKTGASNSEKSDVCDLLKGEESRLPIDSPLKEFSLGTSPPLDFGKIKDTFFPSSSINNQCSTHPCGSNSIEIAVKERYGSQVPYSSAPPVTFTEKCSDALDLHNPNVDSPCWKGAPAFHISLCDSVEAPSQCHLKSKLECSDFGQNNPLFPPAEHSGNSLKKLGEDNLHNHNVYAGIGLSISSEGTGTNNYITKDHRTNDVAKETYAHMDLSSSGGALKFPEDLNKPSKGYNLPQYSENDCQLQSSCGKHQHLSVDEHKYGPTKHSLTEGFMHSGLNLNETLEGGVVALDAAENVLRSPASQEDAKQAQPYQMGSSPKLDVRTLVHAIYNLSELLKSQCLTNACLLEDQDHDALKHAITNLGACTAKKIETKDTMFSQHDTFEKFGESRCSYMGTGTGNAQFMGEVTWDSCRLSNYPMREDKSNNNGKKAENSPLLTPPADALGDSNEELVVQAIKKVLNENFISDEGMQPQALLFKNLWLEAEAKLCSLSYKARFDLMKIEMEKHKSSQGKDLKLNSSVAPEAENDLVSKITTQSPSTLSKSVHIDDSVMERFNILNRREEKLSSSFMEEENDSVKVACDAEDSVTMRLNILRQQGNNLSSSFMEEKTASDLVCNDAEDSVMERFNILRQREDNLKSSFMKEKKGQNVVANDAEDSVKAILNVLRQRGDNLNSSFMEKRKDPDMVANDAENSIKARFNILRQRGDNLNSSFMEEKKDPHMVGNDAEDSIMARLNVLTHRGDNLNSPFMEVKKDLDVVAARSAGMENLGLLKGEVSEDLSANVVIEPYFYHHSVNASESTFGSYADGSMKQFLLSVADDPVVHSSRKAGLGNHHSSGLYDNSSSDWEHVAKDEYV
ncbi:hypothetical protein HAX54_046050 [Datura stramonium]|uniref:Uncharacterized protein n=1 Tax=Datura stramonium TaxID=4076 RepID=A0ABS8SQX2_DATST|nr:hypothetical protein [Datura stramonium]